MTNRINDKLVELKETAANFGPRVQQRTRDKNLSDIGRYEQQRARIGRVHSFTYGTGSDYVNGILGHNDIIEMVPQLIIERPLMRRLVVQQFPFLFVDESQDTTEKVVAALKAVDKELGDQFCLGFFGDPMQQIYLTGIGPILLETGWARITKPENFRCPTSVLNVANAIRRDGDGLVQTRGRMTGPEDAQVSVPGSAHVFIFPTDERRDRRITQVRAWAAAKNDDPQWRADENSSGVKLLVIVHRMAANRLGFGQLYSALNDKAPDKFKNNFLDGSAWPVRPFNSFVLPLVDAAHKGNEFEVIQVLRTQSPLLERENMDRVNVAARLAIKPKRESVEAETEKGASDSPKKSITRFVYKSYWFVLAQTEGAEYVPTDLPEWSEARGSPKPIDELTVIIAQVKKTGDNIPLIEYLSDNDELYAQVEDAMADAGSGGDTVTENRLSDWLEAYRLALIEDRPTPDAPLVTPPPPDPSNDKAGATSDPDDQPAAKPAVAAEIPIVNESDPRITWIKQRLDAILKEGVTGQRGNDLRQRQEAYRLKINQIEYLLEGFPDRFREAVRSVIFKEANDVLILIWEYLQDLPCPDPNGRAKASRNYGKPGALAQPEVYEPLVKQSPQRNQL